MINVDHDAFSSGQIGSKLWMCEELEKLRVLEKQKIWILGGWHGMSAFLLLSRNRFPVSSIRSFDIDPAAEKIANTLLEYWVWKQWTFRAFTADCNHLVYDDERYGMSPTMVINTSTEHFSSRRWYDAIPPGTLTVLQSNNMPHRDHHSCYDSLDGFSEDFPMRECLFKGKLDFSYPTWGFSRYMIIGYKG